jgi:hypothetical protein
MPLRAIFISYRRDDSEGQAGRLYDDLIRQFGEGSVFMDVAASSLVSISAKLSIRTYLLAAFC